VGSRDSARLLNVFEFGSFESFDKLQAIPNYCVSIRGFHPVRSDENALRPVNERNCVRSLLRVGFPILRRLH
jgi:hypothetical protein